MSDTARHDAALTVKKTVRLTRDLDRRLDLAARQDDRDASYVVRRLLAAHLPAAPDDTAMPAAA